MSTTDMTIKTADGVFNYRVGAIIIDSGEILMVRNSGASHYYTVGGRVQFGESALDAVLREAYEETQIHFEIDMLAYIHENFFTMQSSGEIYHEVCMFFIMKPNSKIRALKESSFKEEYGDVTYHWLPIKELDKLSLYPEFFKTELVNLPSKTKYFITKDEITVTPNANSERKRLESI